MARSDRALVTLASAALAGGSLLACNAIIGLSDFEKIECTNYRCPEDDAGGDVVVAPIDAGGDGAIEPGGGADPVGWARWPMPSWPDAGVDPAPAFTTAGDEVRDEVTGLVWMKGDLGSLTYEDAKAKCEAHRGGGWRLPKRIELVTLLDFSRGGANPQAPLALDTKQSDYWTSSQSRRGDGALVEAYWVVDFAAPQPGKKLVTTKPSGGGNVAFARCVKGKS